MNYDIFPHIADRVRTIYASGLNKVFALKFVDHQISEAAENMTVEIF